VDVETLFFRANHLSAAERRQSWDEISQREPTHLPRGSTQFSVYATKNARPILFTGIRDFVERSEVEEAMPLIQIVIVLIVIGVLLWLVNLIPMQGTIKSILNAVVVICVVLWLLNVFGVLSYLPHIRVGT
jgi:hypothetical protein